MTRTTRLAPICLVALLTCSITAAQEPDPEALHRQGAEALHGRDYATAVEALQKAVEQDPANTDAWFKLGQSRSGLGDHTGAIEAYRRVVDLDPQNTRAMNNLANGLFRMGRYEESAEWYRKALDIDPDYLKATFHYGWILRHLDRPEEAEKMFLHCLDLESTSQAEEATRQDCYYYVGALRFRAGDHTRAASIMEEVLVGRPAHPEARYYLGMAYRHLGRTEDAARHLELHRRLLQAMRGSPENR